MFLGKGHLQKDGVYHDLFWIPYKGFFMNESPSHVRFDLILRVWVLVLAEGFWSDFTGGDLQW